MQRGKITYRKKISPSKKDKGKIKEYKRNLERRSGKSPGNKYRKTSKHEQDRKRENEGKKDNTKP